MKATTAKAKYELIKNRKISKNMKVKWKIKYSVLKTKIRLDSQLFVEVEIILRYIKLLSISNCKSSRFLDLGQT